MYRVWLQSPSEENKSWLDKIEKFVEKGQMIVDGNLKEELNKTHKCFNLAYRHDKNETLPSFILSSSECSENISVVCKTKKASPMIGYASKKPHRFPCMQNETKYREKRETIFRPKREPRKTENLIANNSGSS